MNLDEETSLLNTSPILATVEDLRPYLDKLIANPGSAIVIGIEVHAGALRVGRAWLSPPERRALRKALERVNAGRKRREESATSEEVK